VPLETILPSKGFSNYLSVKTPIIVECMDYDCPSCRRIESKIPKEITRIVRHLPLTMHSRSMPAAVLAETSRIDRKFDLLHPKLIFDAHNDCVPAFR
jgi:hypothetical protein